jgi:hypothetical protein
MIITFFNEAMVKNRLVPEGDMPVVSTQINHEKNYAFVEVKRFFVILKLAGNLKYV